MTRRNAAPPPRHLSTRSQELWRELQPEHARSIGRQLLLTIALESLDRCDEIAKVIAREGFYATTGEGSKMPHQHPLIPIEREARRQFIRLAHDLGIDWQYEIDSPL